LLSPLFLGMGEAHLVEKTHRNALQPGHKLLWYEIRQILGQGGFGITYLAHDTNLERDVAIKEYLPTELSVREGDCSVHPVSVDRGKQYKWGLDRFIAEARTLAKFAHSNIVRVLAVFEENNTGYMVMPYEQGQSLQEKLTGKKTLEEPELLKILIPILDGLKQVHEAGFIHRDIKPDNIYIRTDGSPVLLDFGSARHALGEETKTLTSLVTPGYAPFEQYYSKSDEQGPWTDIYGLGATIYRAVAGIAPIDAVDRSRVILETSDDKVVSAVEIGRGKYSERFLKAIDHAIQFKMKDRPQSLAEWRKEFDVVDEGPGISEDDIPTHVADATPGQANKEVEENETSTKAQETVTINMSPAVVSKAVEIPEPEKSFERRNWKTPIAIAMTVVLIIAGYIGWSSYYLQDDKQAEKLQTVEKQSTAEEIPTLQDNAITQLLQSATDNFSAGRLTEPPGQNALEDFLKVLQLDPDNKDASIGKDYIFQHYLQLSDDHIRKQKFIEAETALQRADVIRPDATAVKLAQVRLSDAKAKAERTALEEKRKKEEQIVREEEQKRTAALKKKRQQDEQERKIRAAEQKRLAEVEKLLSKAESAAIEEKRRNEEQKIREEEQNRIAALQRKQQEELHTSFNGTYTGISTETAGFVQTPFESVLTRNGNDVTGISSFGYLTGTLRGVVEGNTLYYNWQVGEFFGQGIAVENNGYVEGIWGYDYSTNNGGTSVWQLEK
jgi:serine/threonine protein kinase